MACGTRTMQCSICRDDIKDPRLLPCIHSFCLGCLERYCTDKQPGDKMPCPLCKFMFVIPENGVAYLPVRTHVREPSYVPQLFEEELNQVISRIECFRGASIRLETKHNKTLENVKAMELEVRKRSEKVVEKFVQLADYQTNDVLHQLRSLESSSLELQSKGSLSDRAHVVSDVGETTKELLETGVSPSEYHASSYMFTPVNIEELIRDDQNFIGHVLEVRDSVPNGATVQGAGTSLSHEPHRHQQVSQESIIQQYLSSAAHVTMRISTDHWVLGVTLVDNELFVLLGRDNWQDKNQVAVYSINDYRRLRHLTVPGYRPDINCYITSCVQRKCLYMSDGEKQVIHRYDLRGGRMKRIVGSHVTSFPVPGTPSGMSVKADGNLVVTCPRLSGAKLVELAVDRIVCLREIELHSDIGCPWHAVQLIDSQFVVCHGGFYRLHRVCAVDADGNVTRSYGGQPGSDVGQLNNPCHLAVDKDTQFIFVADRNNNRVVLLSPTLEFVRYVSQGLSQPSRLYFHQSTRCLYVGQKSGEKGGAISVI